MKVSWFVGICLSVIQASPAQAVDSTEGEAVSPRGEMVLWYRQPGERWLEGMPLGNGILGARVFGRVSQERIALNEGTFWSGRPHDYDDPEAHKYFPQIRDLVFAGKSREAEKMVDEHFFGIPSAQQAYQPLGDLLLSFEGTGAATDYHRARPANRHRHGVLSRGRCARHPRGLRLLPRSGHGRAHLLRQTRPRVRSGRVQEPLPGACGRRAGQAPDGRLLEWTHPGQELADRPGRRQGPALPGRADRTSRRRPVGNHRDQRAHPGSEFRHVPRDHGHELRELPRHLRRPRGQVRDDSRPDRRHGRRHAPPSPRGRRPRADGPRASECRRRPPERHAHRRAAQGGPRRRTSIRTWKPSPSSSAATSWSPAAGPADSPPTSRGSGTNRSRRPGAASTRSTSTPR